MPSSKNPLFSISGNPNDPHRYDDMIDLPNHKSTRHAPMTMENRAAQFSPFAALTGYEAVIEETARLTDDQVELTDEVRQEINRQLQEIKRIEQLHPSVTLTWFLADARKEGGSYKTETITIRKLDDYREVLLLTDGREIPFSDIIEILEIYTPSGRSSHFCV